MRPETKTLTAAKQKLEQIYESKSADSITIPDNFPDFCKTLRVKSGGGLKPFELFDYQESIYDLISEHNYCLVAKGRQTGLSEEACAIALEAALRNEGKNILVISKSTTDVYALAKRLRTMIESMDVPPTLTTDSLSEVTIKATKSTIYFRAGTSAGRGLPSCSLIIFDEFAFFRNGTDEESWSAALPSTEMMDGSEQVVIISTPNGKQNLYWQYLAENNGPVNVSKLIEEVRSGAAHDGFTHFVDTAGWCKIIIHWRAHPIYSKRHDYIEWIIKRKKIPRSKALREYDLDFSSGELTFIAESLVFACAVGALEEPEEDAQYYAGLDPAGAGKDYLCYSIIRCDRGKNELVAFHRGRKQGFERHKRKIKSLNEKYRPQRVLVESNGLGQLYLEALTSEQPAIPYEGIAVTKSNRTQILDGLAVEVETENVLFPAGIYSEELCALEEKSNGRVEAAKGFHDDSCFSLAHSIKAAELGPVWNPFDDVDFGGGEDDE